MGCIKLKWDLNILSCKKLSDLTEFYITFLYLVSSYLSKDIFFLFFDDLWIKSKQHPTPPPGSPKLSGASFWWALWITRLFIKIWCSIQLVESFFASCLFLDNHFTHLAREVHATLDLSSCQKLITCWLTKSLYLWQVGRSLLRMVVATYETFKKSTCCHSEQFNKRLWSHTFI